MIDTVILKVPVMQMTLVDMNDHGVPKWDLQKRERGYEKYIKNPSSKDKANGLYFPNLTLDRRKNDQNAVITSIRIQFSAPKLIYKNNLDELEESQFSQVVSVLHDRLERLGIRMTRQDLESAAVISVHYSKNIALTNNYTAQYVISELGKINLNKRFDFARARFMNDGQSLCAHVSTHELVIYDKIADLAKGSRRSIDRDQSDYQMGLFGQLKKKREILRFEVRLSRRQKMNALFKQLGFAEDPTFRDAFSVEKSTAVLMHYWNTMIESNSLLLFAHTMAPKDLLNQILLANKRTKATTAIYLAGLSILAPDGNGVRELRSILSKRSTDRTWYRIYADLKTVAKRLSKLKPRDWYEQVRQGLNSSEPYRIDSS